jgi:virginiamycin B lyase
MSLLPKSRSARGAVLVLCVLAPALAVAGDPKIFKPPTDNSRPSEIVLGTDGAMWFTETNIDVSQIGRVAPDGTIIEFVVPTRFSQPEDIVSGFDGVLWFMERSGFPNGIGRITIAGELIEYGLDPISSLTPNGIASGPDNNIWFTEFNRNAIGRLERAGTGTFTFFDLPTPSATPAGITAGPDGVVTEFGPVAGPMRITVGPDANLWFTHSTSGSCR